MVYANCDNINNYTFPHSVDFSVGSHGHLSFPAPDALAGSRSWCGLQLSHSLFSPSLPEANTRIH